MSLEKYYGVLGLKPDASEQEVKNAYRDLAKVWHPDRFAHDPRLQQKAQEKLKEINEAYEAINSPASSRRAYRSTPPPPPPSTSTSAPRTPRGPDDFTRGPDDFTTVVARRGDERASSLLPVACAVGLLVITFFVSYRFLNSNTAAPAGVSPPAAAELSEEQRAEVVSDAGGRVERKPAGKQPRAGEGAGTAAGGEGNPDAGARQPAPAYKALPTVNRTIDPATGLLATRACPLKAIRTFASGEEPQKFCDADHTRR